MIIGAIAELERSLIVERVRAGMRRAKLEGRHIGRKPLEFDRPAIFRDRASGQSLAQLAKSYRVSRATIRILNQIDPTLNTQQSPPSLPGNPLSIEGPVRTLMSCLKRPLKSQPPNPLESTAANSLRRVSKGVHTETRERPATLPQP